MAHVLGVIGESTFSDPANEQLAEEVGRRIAQAGCTLVCGGLTGVMEAACRGAKSAGGLTVAILPGPDRSAANPFVDVAIATNMGWMRNVAIVLTADALIAVGGGFGTLSEIGHALSYRKPLVGLRTWEAARAGTQAPITVVETPQQAVETALRLLAS